MVLDLVHPSLVPLVYGKSRILPVGSDITTLDNCIQRCGEGEHLPELKETWPTADYDAEDSYSGKFQWLPCEVDISGKSPKYVGFPRVLSMTFRVENMLQDSNIHQ